MALFNHAKREINAKIVYYGHEGSGKRDSLQYIYDRIKPSLRGELKSLPTGGNTLLFFDFSPFEKTVFGGYRIRFHMYSLVGRVANPAAWKMTLKTADGLVIVADSAPEKLDAARESISLLRDWLGAYGTGLHDIPCVLQVNRPGRGPQSCAAITPADLDVPDMPSCSSESASGEGVLEVLSLLSREIVDRIGQDDALRKPASDGRSDAGVAPESTNVPASRFNGDFLEHSDSRPASDGQIVTESDGPHDTAEEVQVVITAQGAEVKDGIVRVPFEIGFGGVKRRLVVSIAVEPL